MKKVSQKFIKILMLISMIFSSLQTPLYVLADTITPDETYQKGDMRLGTDGEIEKDGSVTVQAGAENLNTGGNIQVIKTVSAVDANEGKYKVDFLIKGKDVQNIITTTKPIYFVIVFDTSGSMICDSTKNSYASLNQREAGHNAGKYEAADGTTIYCSNASGSNSSNILSTKWENAVSGAVNFTKQLATIDNTYASVVTFASTANNATDFRHGEYVASEFGHPVGGTNLSSAINKAQAKLDTIEAENAQKYILVISDGEPNSTRDAKNSADEAKSDGTKIYAIGYGITSGSTAESVLKYISSNTTVTPSENFWENDTVEYEDKGYYQSAGTDGLSESLKTVFESVGEPSKAGINATLTDGIGEKFKIVTENDEEISEYGVSYVSSLIPEITEEGTNLSFYIQIDQDAPTGWYNTNNDFTLSYTDASGNKQTITCDENPQVYWVQNQYKYTVNYYKDSITNTTDDNFLGSAEGEAPAGEVIDASKININQFLVDAGISYEFSNIDPEDGIIITNNENTNVINVLYIKVYGNLTVKYIDATTSEDLLPPVTTTKEVGTSYTTQKEDIYGYTLSKVDGEETGTYTKEDITVIYTYTKNPGTEENIKGNEIVKTQINTIIGANSKFKYVLTYTGRVEDYVGSATVTITDTLPYEVLSIDYDKTACTYNETTRLLTCTKTVELDKDTQEINATFNVEVTYKNLTSEIDLTILNKATSTLTFGETTKTDESEVSDVVETGTVIAKYVDEANKDIADSVTITGLIDTNYKTEKQTIYGYTFKEVDGNETGKYAEEDITVTYIYTKNEGTTETNEVTKVGPENVSSVNGVFNYTLTYEGKITDYVGNATLTLKDTLPYEIDEEKSSYEGCTYDNKILTCTKTFTVDEEHQEINAKFNLSIVFKDIDSNKVTNKVESTLDYGKETPDKDTAETETEVFKGTVIAKYVDEANKEIADSITTTGLIDTDYKTEKQTIYGYTFKEVDGSETGKYAEEDITVTYIYTKNEGTTETNKVTKVGPKNVSSVNGVFNYTLTYEGKITDYVGNATLTLKDTLPYEIDEEKSSYEGCTYDNKILTCTKTFTVDEEHQEINAKFNLSIVFKNIDSNKVTNKVESTLDYGKETPDKDTDETETEVSKGTVIATYRNTEGEELAQNIIKDGLAGNAYETEKLEFLGYTLTKVPTNQNGVYNANETIYVNYIYSKNIGTSKENLEKQGPSIVTDINSPFEYKITYNLEIFDYVGDVKITLTDYLPYEIDEEKSSLGNVCQYADGKLVCVYLQAITNKENSKINVEENLILYYKNITSNKVTNRIESQVIYGTSEKNDEDEYTTEIPYGTIKVNYVTDDGKTLSQTIINTGLVGATYDTEQKVFDNYYLKEIIGKTSGAYKEEETEVTYVYSLVPLPPQTGVENNTASYIGLIIFSFILLVLKRRYL